VVASCTIGRLHLALAATAAPSRGESLLARLRDVAARRVPDAIAAGLDQITGHGLVFIDRLSFDCVLNAAWDDDQLGKCLARDFIHALKAQADGRLARRFADRAEFVAGFLIALAEGSADRQWWFDEFDGLRLLPLSAALRTVVVNEGEVGWEALVRLTSDAAQRVLRALTPGDAERLLDGLTTGRADASVGLDLLRAAVASPLAQSFAAPVQRALGALVALERTAPGTAGRAARLALSRLEALYRAARAGALSRTLAAGLPPASMLMQCCTAAGIEPVAPTPWPDSEVAVLIDELRSLSPPAAIAETSMADAVPELSPWGGAWLLLAQLARLGWWERWRASLLAELGNDAARADSLAATLVLAVVARALAGEQHAAVGDDLTLRRALGLPSPATRTALGVARGSKAAALVRAQVRVRGTSVAPAPVPDFGTSPPIYASTALGAGRQRRIALIEVFRGTVVGLYRPPSAPRGIAAALPADALLISAPDAQDPTAAQAEIRSLLSWWRAHDPLLSPRTHLERELHLSALNLLRELSSRLPGCGDASAAYLRRECLTMPAGVSIGPTRIEVGVGRPPLDVLLTLAGVKRSSTVLPDGRTLVIEAGR